ncbi:hypothetical protein [Hymenobacter cellulosivorans]|uniref:Lipoprotein n=1 Tax=Hymenobacter cellulosivorans TaxID=2932249 RepID=A0ABY4F3G3_9BACT|nr:hypothetical protein [Hymenobacter cellulosivorans]UOQ51202.1 hypothetical protein MUN80_15680 [Hymenobacter cellulosivorans]
MPIFTRSLFLLALTTASLLTSCSDKNEEPAPTPDPAPTYALSHYFYYPATNGAAAVIHPNQDITGKAQLHPTVLALDFEAKADMPHFEIERAQLKPDWKGVYPLRCRARPADPVFVSYSYHTDGYRIFRFSDFTQTLTGHVTITAYDTKRQLISGTYEVQAPGQTDPLEFSIDTKCDITLSGSFTDLKVKPQP